MSLLPPPLPLSLSLQPSLNTLSTSPSLHRPTVEAAKPSPAVAAPHPEGASLLGGRLRLEHDDSGAQMEELRSQMKELVLTVELLKAQQM